MARSTKVLTHAALNDVLDTLRKAEERVGTMVLGADESPYPPSWRTSECLRPLCPPLVRS
jgi:hypothetical protein